MSSKSSNANKELEILINYFVNHNKAHEKEFLELLNSEAIKNNKEISKYIEAAIRCYKDGNSKLEQALKVLKK